MKKIIIPKKGGVSLLTCVFLIAVLSLGSFIFEYIRIQLIADGISASLQSAVSAFVLENYRNVYPTGREKYSGGYTLDGADDWQININYSDIYGLLDISLGTVHSGGDRIKYAGGSVEYTLSGLRVNVTHSPLSPADPDGAERFRAEAFVDVEIPYSFGWQSAKPVKFTLKVISGYSQRY